MVLKSVSLYLFTALVYAVSIDCPDVINFAQGLNMGLSNPRIMKALQKDCCASDGVGCVSGRVDYIFWVGLRLSGSINVTALPRMMTYLEISYNKITGIIDGDIPPYLDWVYLNSNLITGELPDISSSVLEFFEVSNNKFTGSFPQLPSTMGYFYMTYNMISGCIPDNLPSSL
eukprot:NODE_505_length_7533_cov_0.471886.p4 type:complete len:173 gc:universal NODE_505_length_7533_cov_0.471886:6823-7341(+)